LLNFGRNVRFQSTNEITFEVGFISWRTEDYWPSSTWIKEILISSHSPL
jgi:hypothetical protein